MQKRLIYKVFTTPKKHQFIIEVNYSTFDNAQPGFFELRIQRQNQIIIDTKFHDLVNDCPDVSEKTDSEALKELESAIELFKNHFD